MKGHYSNLLVKPDEAVLRGIEIIEGSVSQIALVIDDNEILLGTLTNGDVRRFLMGGGSVESNVTECMNSDFRWVGPNASREEILKLFDLGIHAIPIIDESRTLLDFVTPALLCASASPEVDQT